VLAAVGALWDGSAVGMVLGRGSLRSPLS